MRKFFKFLMPALLVLALSMVVVACGGGGNHSNNSESKKDDSSLLAAPTDLSLDNLVLSWNEVDGATGYEVSVDGTTYTKIEGAEVKVDTIITSTSVTKLYVRAVGGKAAEYPVVVTKLATPNKPRIETDEETKSQKFVWDKVTDAKKYLIKVNDGKWIVNSSTQFATTESGIYTLTVKCRGYSDDNYIYLESEPSETSDELNLLIGATLINDVIHTLQWDTSGFDSFNLWVDGECAAENVLPGENGYNFVEEGVVTKTGEYDMQLECKKGDTSAWSNVLVEVGTKLINENEICSFDNRKISVNNVDGASLTRISTDIKHGDKGASMRIERGVQINLNLTGSYIDQLNLHTVEGVSYWVYLEKPDGSTDEEASVGYIPLIVYDSWYLGAGSQRFNPKNITGTTVPWNTWFEVQTTVNILHSTTLIIKHGGPCVAYVDDIYYTSLIEEPENAEENGLASDKAIRFVKGHYTASYQCTTINLGAEFGGHEDVWITMDVYLHTKEATPFGLALYSWQEGQVNTSGNKKDLPIGYIHYKTPSNLLNVGQWNRITFKATKIDTNGDFKFSPGCYEDQALGFSFSQATYWIYVKNVSAEIRAGYQTAYNANGAQHKNKTNVEGSTGIAIAIDTSKFDSDASTTEYVNVSMKVKGSVVGELTGAGCIDVSRWGVGNGYYATGNYIVSGAASWNEILTSDEWIDVTLRLPVQDTNSVGSIVICPFFFPGYNVCTLEAKEITVDYSSISD